MPIMQLAMIWNPLWKGVTAAEQVLAEMSRMSCAPCCTWAAHEEYDHDWKPHEHITVAIFSHRSVSLSADTQKKKKKGGGRGKKFYVAVKK